MRLHTQIAIRSFTQDNSLRELFLTRHRLNTRRQKQTLRHSIFCASIGFTAEVNCQAALYQYVPVSTEIMAQF